MIKALIFDFFGVIVGEGFDATYRHAGGDPEKDRDFIAELLERTNRGVISSEDFRRQICRQLGITPEDYAEAIKKTELPNRELLDYIKVLRKKYKTAILSNVAKGGLERRLSREILDEHFDVLVVSGDTGYIKPEPQIYELTAKKLGVQLSECFFTDDREGYVEAAKSLGIKAVLYRNFPQLKSELEEVLASNADN